MEASEMTRGTFSPIQVGQLLKPINPKRVLEDGKGHSHVSQQDVTAHLIRVFGFGSFDIKVLDASLVFESERHNDKGELTGRWDICYKAMVRLTVRDPQGVKVAFYENGSTATAQNQTRGDAHDLAYKSAISLSIKRAAIALGDQMGLSLYNRGQKTALVMSTLVGMEHDGSDVQANVSQQVSLGNDEIDPDEAKAPEPPNGWKAKIATAQDKADLSEIHQQAIEGGWSTPEVMAALTARGQQL